MPEVLTELSSKIILVHNCGCKNLSDELPNFECSGTKHVTFHTKLGHVFSRCVHAYCRCT